MQSGGKPIKAAQYVRMSTERQVYSTVRQSDRNAAYALISGFEIVRTYADEGRSGLQLKGRPGLQRLLTDVLSSDRGFDAIIVYDVSRWGRFQDTDEGAHYEFLCRRAGVPVHYSAETFENDGSLTAAVMKSLKRVMAGEFSRDLSDRVFAAQCRIAAEGYKMGGTATYGLRRLLVDHSGRPRVILKRGEYKISGTDRVILVPGPPDEVATVRRIFRMSAHKGMSDPQIADHLNAAGIVAATGGLWTRAIIMKLLCSEIYIGTAVYNRRSSRLHAPSTPNPSETWIRKAGAFEPLIDKATFLKVQAVRHNRRVPRLSDDELLQGLRRLLAERGRLSSRLIMTTEWLADSQTYQKRFGSLDAAYARIGYYQRHLAPAPESPGLEARAMAFASRTAAALRRRGASVIAQPARGLFTIDGATMLATTVSRHRSEKRGDVWSVRLNRSYGLDYVFAGLMHPGGERVQSYLLLPAACFPPSGLMTIKAGVNKVERFIVPGLTSLRNVIRDFSAKTTGPLSSSAFALGKA